MKYDTQISELKNKLSQYGSVLISLPEKPTFDQLAAALALYLALKQSGKQASIVCSGDLKVAQASLFGIGDIQKELPQTSSGNFTLILEGVVGEHGKIPSEKLDYHVEGRDLHLVFNVPQGQKFEPVNISHRYDKTNFDLVIFVGVSNLDLLGAVYTQNLQSFAEAIKVNIDLSDQNNLFGQINIVDPLSSSVSEMVSQIIQGLGLPEDSDIASNLIAGIYDATDGLSMNVSADTFLSLGQQMQMGGKLPHAQSGGFDLSALPMQAPAAQVEPAPEEKASQEEQVRSQLETPTGEFASSPSPEAPSPAPDWLTPKIFRGGSLG